MSRPKMKKNTFHFPAKTLIWSVQKITSRLPFISPPLTAHPTNSNHCCRMTVTKSDMYTSLLVFVRVLALSESRANQQDWFTEGSQAEMADWGLSATQRRLRESDADSEGQTEDTRASGRPQKAYGTIWISSARHEWKPANEGTFFCLSVFSPCSAQ